jgi:hypothetical protein
LMDRKPLFDVLREYVQSGEKNKINYWWYYLVNSYVNLYN